MPTLTLREMTDEEFDAWLARLVEAYAADHVAARNWSQQGAVARSREQTNELLPHGRASAGMRFCHGVNADGDVVGTVWVGLQHPRGVADCAWLYDFEVHPDHRHAGYGSALLAAAEELIRSTGTKALMR